MINEQFLPHPNGAQVVKPMDIKKYTQLLSDPYVKIWFVSDLHFGDPKQLYLESQRHQLPFKNLSKAVTQYPKEVVDTPEFKEILFHAIKDQYLGRKNLFMGHFGFRLNKNQKYNLKSGSPVKIGKTVLDKPIPRRPILKFLLSLIHI